MADAVALDIQHLWNLAVPLLEVFRRNTADRRNTHTHTHHLSPTHTCAHIQGIPSLISLHLTSGKDGGCDCVYVRVLTVVSCLHGPVLSPVSVIITQSDTNKPLVTCAQRKHARTLAMHKQRSPAMMDKGIPNTEAARGSERERERQIRTVRESERQRCRKG